jgi:hypothetical protein
MVFVKVKDPNRLKPQLVYLHLNLHLSQAVLPDSNVRGDTILAVVEEDDHAVGVHRLAGEELVVLEVANDLLGKALGLGLEILDLCLVGALCLEGLLYGLHVACHASVQYLRCLHTCYTPLRYVR